MNGSGHLPEHTGAAQLVGATSPGEPNAWPADAGEFAARYNSWTPGVREEWLQRRIQSSQEAERCFLQMHEGRIEQLTAECDALRAQLDGMTEGSKRIAAERARSIEVEGYTPEHDAGHAGELALAAQSYALAAASDVGVLTFVGNDPDDPPFDWPWHPSYWKPTGDTVRDLEKAGGLIASAIDSILSVEVTD